MPRRPPLQQAITIRFYEELNDFLAPSHRKTTFEYHFQGKPSVKDAIEGLGVPHTEVDLILVNGVSVDFGYCLRPGDRISVYPVFESLDISSLNRLRPSPLRRTGFVADVHLGKLVRLLRLMGFDTSYRHDFDDREIVQESIQQRRIILTRDRGLLKHGNVTHGYYVRNVCPLDQAREVVRRFDLEKQVNPFSRCIECNATLETVAKDELYDRLPERTRRFFYEFYICTGCSKIYWKGSHYEQLRKKLQTILGD